MSFQKIIDQYFELEKLIHSHVNYKEDWVKFPLNDVREYFWKISNNTVRYAEDPSLLPDDTTDSEDYYEDEIYKQRFLPQWIYRGEEITLILVDTKTDGNKFLNIYDNQKEIK